MNIDRTLRLASLAALLSLVPVDGRAQDDAPVEGDVPMDGTDVSTGGVEHPGESETFVEPFAEAHAEPPELPEGEEDDEAAHDAAHPDNVLWTLGAGGTLSYGNSRTAGLNVSTSLALRQGNDVGSIEGSFLYAVAQSPLSCGAVQASPAEFPSGTVAFCGPSGTGMSPRSRAPGFNDWAETAVNLNWRVRYDHFFDDENAFYLLHRGRVDRFAGLRPRVGLGLGYSRVLLEARDHLFALDLGIDGTFDFYPETIQAQTHAIVAGGGTLPLLSGTDARFVPSLRLGITYVNHLNPYLTYDTTFDALWDVANPTHARFEWINHLRSAIDRTFQIRLDVTMRLDALPPGQAQPWIEDATTQTTTMFDILTTLNLVGSFDLDGEPVHHAPVHADGAPAEDTREPDTGAHVDAATAVEEAEALEATEAAEAAEDASLETATDDARDAREAQETTPAP